MKNQIKKIFGENSVPHDLEKIPGTLNIIRALHVNYLHIKLANGDDLYLTKYGLPIYKNLMPENYWSDKKWLKNNSIKLSGTSSVYKIKTKEFSGRSREIVLKWNRMGQDVPGEWDIDNSMTTEFNSPFEEFSLLEELRNSRNEFPGIIRTQLPLAIFVPAGKVTLFRLGRKEYQLKKKIKNHLDIKLDFERNYSVIYQWIKGFDAVEAYKKGLLSEEEMGNLTLSVEKDMKKQGYIIKDRKPHHIILKKNKKGNLIKDKNKKLLYAVIDYELLTRTSDREKMIIKLKRQDYLVRQVNRFNISINNIQIPNYLHKVEFFGTTYISGHVESTNGHLWVVGYDPSLFDYFLPERWEHTPKNKLSDHHQIYHTVTKDKINFVWKSSKVGSKPNKKEFEINKNNIIRYGYNSPFEEISIALELNKKGIRIIYPRAIYMMGKKTIPHKILFDNHRYKTHKHFITFEGKHALRRGYNYITIWGYWNGSDEKLATKDADYYQSIDLLNAYEQEIITKDQFNLLLERKYEKLENAGFVDLNFKSKHLLLSLDKNNKLIYDESGLPEERICNFELIKKIE
jgi:hypothetical protein